VFYYHFSGIIPLALSYQPRRATNNLFSNKAASKLGAFLKAD